jgi:tricorn protease
MARTPDIHGDRIVFSAEGDLWLGSLSAGTAARITTDEGTEIDPRFSPDGRQIAFTGQYDGGTDVYVMPAEGGAPRRLTYDPGGAEMVAWTPDGSHILFRSRRGTPMLGFRLYLVPAAGGLPTPLPMERAGQGAYSPDGRLLAYCMRPAGANNWKRYKGGEANHIWVADLAGKTFRRIDDDAVNEQCPLWAGDRLYYLSERDGTANLWRWDPKSGRSTRLTAHDTYDMKTPGTDGTHLIYAWGNGLWLYDLKTGEGREIRMTLATDRLHARPHTLPGAVADFSLGPAGKRLVVEGRGQLATIPAEKGEVRAVAPLPGTRARQPIWSPDGKQIAFLSDRGGEENLWIAPASGAGAPRQLTHDSGVHLHDPHWSPDGKRLAYWDETQALWLVEAESGAKTEVARSDYGPIGDFRFSPDGKWLAYSRPENYFVQSLYLYNLASKQATRLTFPPTRDSNPVFDPDGKYLYFLSLRHLQPRDDEFDFQINFEGAGRIYLISLAADTPAPIPVESDEEGQSQPPATPAPGTTQTATATPSSPAAKGEGEKGAAGSAKSEGAKLPDLKVDLDGISERLMELPIAGGSYAGLDALPGKILYLARDPGDGFKLKQFDLKTAKEMDLASDVQGYDLSFDHKKIAVRTGGGIQIADAGAPIAPGAGRVDLSGWRITVNPELEWKQIFEEAWRNHRDSFYDPHLHGQDWQAVRAKYEALLPSLGSRAELNTIIADMQGEMNVSHEFVGGGYSRLQPQPSPGYGALGADLVLDPAVGAYRIAHLLRGDGFETEARSPLLTPGLNVHEGDYLLLIDGQALTADQDPNALLIGLGGKPVALTVNSKPTQEGARTIRIKAMPNEGRARYYDWVGHNREYVRKFGSENLAYLHVPDMGGFGMAEFSKQFYANLDKDGLVLDVRYNGGGITSGMILERLRRIIFEYDQGRYGAPEPYHRTAYIGRVVVLCNDATGSDGEYFCTGFRAMKLGATVGTRTWGGFMAVGGISAIDGGFISTPVQGSFTPEGKWLPDGYGFNPDYVVPDDPNAFVAGRDPQLDKAIEVLKEEIKRDPPHWPKRLDPPSKEKAFGPNKK